MRYSVGLGCFFCGLVVCVYLPTNMAFRVGHLNVRSLRPKVMEVRELLLSRDFDFFGITETWLGVDDGLDDLAVQGYLFYSCARGSRGGGVGFYIKNKYLPTVCEQNCSEDIEFIWVKTKVGKEVLSMGVIYRPLGNIPNFISCLDDLFSSFAPLSDRVFCLGDFNLNALECNNMTDRFEEILVSYDLKQIVTEPTRVTATSSTLIDLIIVNNETHISEVSVLGMHGLSDHSLVCCSVRLQSKLSIPVKKKVLEITAE